MSDELILKNLKVKYKTISVKHLQELQLDIDKLEQAGKITNNEVIRSYIANFKFQQLDDFQDAKYIIALAIEGKLALVDFHYNGQKHEVKIPPNYLTNFITDDELKNFILQEIIKDDSYRVERTRKVHLKRLATRSGLGKYGRNNICYVDELGSFTDLYCFFTDYDFNEDNWSEVSMLEQCEKCSICINNCPTNAITRDDFVINVEKCIPLYNEINSGPFPEFIPKDAHNALIGCLHCQEKCPANRIAIKNVQRFPTVTEEETLAILAGTDDEEMLKNISGKIQMYHPEFFKYLMPAMQRNLTALLLEK